MYQNEPSASATEPLRAVFRFGLRLLILAAFALASSQPFWAVLTTLLVVAASVSVLLAVMQREPILGADLSHWDEAACYALLSRGTVILATGGPAG